MEKTSYSIISPERNFYSFVSTGKNGEILKAVVFDEFLAGTFNLALLDYDVINNIWSDTVSTNNGDLSKVMATVVAIIDEFLKENPDVKVYFEGNTMSKNSLYNRIISNNFDYLSSNYEIWAKQDGDAEPYQFGKDYKGFYIYKKETK